MYVSHTMETEYDLKKYPNCELRSEGRAAKASVFIMNHFYELFVVTGKTDNSYGFMKNRIKACYSQEAKWPNFIVIDLIGNNPASRLLVLNINQGVLDTTDENTRSSLDSSSTFSRIAAAFSVGITAVSLGTCGYCLYKKLCRHKHLHVE